MTIWQPEISDVAGPRYLAIANAIAVDVASGRLKAGNRLPTHRDLASRLGVTVGTVSRAYAETEKRGVTQGEVGRGTFVRQPRPVGHELDYEPLDSPVIDLSLNRPAIGAHSTEVAQALSALAQDPTLERLLSYQPEAGMEAHREAGATWVRRFGLDASADQIIVTNGGQHSLHVLLSTLTRPGDCIAVEALTYPGIKAIAHQQSLHLYGLEMDNEGIKPEAFDAACRSRKIHVLVCVPTRQNPTNVDMTETRRRDIAEVAREHDVTLIEDDVYGFLMEEHPAPLAFFAPERTCYVTSASKCMAPALRLGYVHAPRNIISRAITGVRTSVWMASPITAEIAMRWINDGTGERLALWQRQEVAERQAIAARLLGQWYDWDGIASQHIWLPLPSHWRADEFAARAREQGVSLRSSSTFLAGRGPAPEAVRLCLGGARTRMELERALTILADVLAEHPTPDFATI